jgi:hypothetical protein
MALTGFRKTNIPYDMFDLEATAAEAKRLTKCERIYHKGQELAWDGKDVLSSLVEKHGRPSLAPADQHALGRLFTIILWGELAAWRISTQLADRLIPLEAKMAATSQAHDEARHFYVMYDYLQLIGYKPGRLDWAPQALLDLVLDTDNLTHKLLGMQLMIEPLALTIFQTVRELEVEPVLSELLTYYERDEARHVGLGMQYLPTLMAGMKRHQSAAMIAFQMRVLSLALLETKVLEPDLRQLGLDPRAVLERGRRKQLAALGEAFAALGVVLDGNLLGHVLNAAAELMFPDADAKPGRAATLKAVWNARRRAPDQVPLDEFNVHSRHTIRTARGVLDHGGDADLAAR